LTHVKITCVETPGLTYDFVCLGVYFKVKKSGVFISEFVCDPDHFYCPIFVWKVISRTKSGVLYLEFVCDPDYFIVPVIRLAGVIEDTPPV
jgi:hypothetical protein